MDQFKQISLLESLLPERCIVLVNC